MSELNGYVSKEFKGSKGLLVAEGDRGSSSNKLDVNENGFRISPEIRDEGSVVVDGRCVLPIEERSGSMLIEPEAGDKWLVKDATEGGNHLGVLPEATDGCVSSSLDKDGVIVSSSLDRDDVMIESEVSNDLMDLPEFNDSLDTASELGNQLKVLPEDSDYNGWEIRDHYLVLPEVKDGLADASEHGDHLLVLPEVNNLLDVEFEPGDHLNVQPEVSDGSYDASEHSDHFVVLPKVTVELNEASEQGDHLVVLPEVTDDSNDASKHSNHFLVLPEVKDGPNDASEINDLPITPRERDCTISGSGGSVDEMISLEVSNNLTKSREGSGTSEVEDGLTSALETNDEGLVALEGRLDSLNTDDTSIDHSKAVGDSGFDPTDIQVTKYETSINTQSETSINTQPDTSDNTQPETSINTESEKSINTQSETSINTETETSTNTYPETSINTQSETSINAEAETSTNAQSETSINTQSEKSMKSESETLINTQSETSIHTRPDTSINTQSETSINTQSETLINTESETSINTQFDSSINTQLETVINTQSETLINTESETSINTQSATSISASPSEDRSSHSSSQEEQFNCMICGEGFSDPNKLSSHKLLHSVNFSKCEVCGKAFWTTDDLQHHRQLHSTDHDKCFSCDVCVAAFSTRSSLLNHQTISHPCKAQESSKKVNQEIRYVCRHCKDVFPCKQELLEHEANHAEKKPLICSRCSKVCTSLRSLQWHMATHKNKSYHCAKCGTSFKSYYLLSRHKQVHKDRPFSCDICRKTFRRQEALRNHCRHHEEESLICDKCNKKFKTRVEWNRHKRSHKTVEKHHDCDVCNKSYKQAAHLKKHKLSHKSTPKKKPHSCRFCQQSYSNLTKLSLHLQTHDKAKLGTSSGRSNGYNCGICSSSFKTFYSMKKHKQMHKERPYMCSICEETFTVDAALRRHKLRKCSSGYTCEVCNESFSTTHQLQSHSLKHISLKAYMCRFCHECFKTTKQLRKHMLLHTGSKPHICQVCNKRFAEFEKLTRHKKICNIGLKSSMLSKTSKQALDQNKTSNEQPVNEGLTGVDDATSGEGGSMLVEMSCAESLDCPQEVSADPESSQMSDTSNDAKPSPKVDLLISEIEKKKLQVRIEKFIIFICDVCDKSFASQSLFDRHMVKHNEEVPQRNQPLEKSVQNQEQQKQKSPKPVVIKQEPSTKPIKKEAHAMFKCDECSRAFPHEYGLNLHKKWVHAKDESHRCTTCGKTYKHKFHFTEHLKVSKSCNPASANEQETVKDKQETAKKLRCDVCGERFALIENYKDHVADHFDEAPVKCDSCDKRYTHKAGLEFHKAFLCNRTNDPNSAIKEFVQPKEFKCEVCNGQFSYIIRFKDHLRSHSDARPFSCEACGKSFKYPRDIRVHELKHCPRRTKAKPKIVTPMGNLNKQAGLKRRVSNPRKWKCKRCGKDFTSKELLALHSLDCALHQKGCLPYKRDKESEHQIDIQKHSCNSKPVVFKSVTLNCKVCGEKFNRFVRQGIEHANIKCKSCSILKTKPTGAKRTVKPKETVPGLSATHNATAKGSEEAQSKSAMIQKSPNKISNNIFANRTPLKQHKQNHNDKSFKCNKCNRKFVMLQALQMHKRKSHGSSDIRYLIQKKVKCNFCDKLFRFPYELERHEVTHSSEKQYKCECGKAFKLKYELNRHRRYSKHHKHQLGPEPGKTIRSPQAAKSPKSSGKPTQTRHDSEEDIDVDGIDVLQAPPLKPDPMHSDNNAKGSFSCNKCDKKFTLKKSHMLHERRCTALQCHFCSVFFTSLVSLRTHEKIHTGRGDTKLHSCYCGKSYSNRANLRRHQTQQHSTKTSLETREKIHTGLGDTKLHEHSCYCGKSYSNKTNLRRHQTKHHPTKTSVQLKQIAPSAAANRQQSSNARFKCRNCSKVFLDRRGLERHEKTKKFSLGCIDVPRGKEETAVHQSKPSKQTQRMDKNKCIRKPSGNNMVKRKANQKPQQNNAPRFGGTQHNRQSLESFKQHQQFPEGITFAHNPENHNQEVFRSGFGSTHPETFAENGPRPRVVSERFKCEVCAHVWSTKSMPEKKNKQKRACPSCGSVFSYKIHEQTSNKNIPQTKSVFKPTVKSHQSQRSDEEFPVVPSGSKDFHEEFSPTRSNPAHLQEVPGPERIRACRICGKFFMKNYILAHEQSHSNDIPVHRKVSETEESLCRSDGRNTNVERANLTQLKQSHYKPYPCESCSLSFGTVYNLQIHAAYYCNQLKKEATGEETQESTEGEQDLLKCGVCSTYFNSMPLLVDHMKRHK
ncbi:uncharacterized protein LOC117292557 [Asterias rubens]|uniref:uncharacterized protein LOC117292557 n=1 Tax=Asterias rubens TaxID=7604 RepID=UPI001454E6A5|nr:uncharacterized protein LOC117292557 [Asterias rubens]XP_033630548.1 uncharacterized protein LOC117292557 [Asterias rubens]